MNKTKRVLHVVSAMNRGGAETLLMNVYRNLDRTRIQFDFVSHRKEICDYDDEISLLGGNVFRISSLGQIGPIAYIKQLKQIMSVNQYAAVHAHTDYQCGFPAFAAKMSGIKKRICHAHSNNWTKGYRLKEKILLSVLRKMIRYSATDCCACSVEAAAFLFGRKMVNNGKVKVLKNGIEVDLFSDTSANCRSSVRQELNISSQAKIIGHVGSLSQIKNQLFILKILKKLLEEGEHFVAVFAGDGPLKSVIEDEAKKMGVRHHIRLLGMRSDIPRLMRAFDVFLFPSLYEGFGIVTLEAQSSGTPCVVSDAVPKATDMGLGLISYLSLGEDVAVWCKAIQKALVSERPDSLTIRNKFSKLGFDIQKNIPVWLSLYESF